MFYPIQPYFLLIAGLLISLTCGSAFQATLKLSARRRFRNDPTAVSETAQSLSLLIPFLGIAVGACLFLSAGLALFSFPLRLTWLVALPLTGLTASLVWFQLRKLIVSLRAGNLRALDLDWLE